jgi:hypothetical protein
MFAESSLGGVRMPTFHVLVKRDAAALDPSLFDFEQDVKSQNAVHAAACGLLLAGGGYAEAITVTALCPVPGRPASTTFGQCSQGVYGFCFLSRS